MKLKQVFYTTTVWNPVTRKNDKYKIPTPEYIPDYSGLIGATGSLTTIAIAAILFLYRNGVV